MKEVFTSTSFIGGRTYLEISFNLINQLTQVTFTDRQLKNAEDIANDLMIVKCKKQPITCANDSY